MIAMPKLGFGDHRVLQRICEYGPVARGEGMNWTMTGMGLAAMVDGLLTITAEGRRYLKKNKCPPLPHSRSHKYELVLVDGNGI
jgi:hypothetical protein